MASSSIGPTDRDDRMTAREAGIALGLRASAVQNLVATAQLHRLPALPSRKGATFARTEVETLAANRARRMSTLEATARAGLKDTEEFRRWFKTAGGTVHRHGKMPVYEPDDVDRVRQAMQPVGIATVEAASLLGVSVSHIARLVRQGDLAALTSSMGCKGRRFDREVVLAYKQNREYAPIRTMLDRWPTAPVHGSTAIRTDGRTVHHARHDSDGLDVMALSPAWQAW
ncbi:helix-turn-helix domain-containing protein, partial [Burkholderia gladioli]